MVSICPPGFCRNRNRNGQSVTIWPTRIWLLPAPLLAMVIFFSFLKIEQMLGNIVISFIAEKLRSIYIFLTRFFFFILFFPFICIWVLLRKCKLIPSTCEAVWKRCRKWSKADIFYLSEEKDPPRPSISQYALISLRLENWIELGADVHAKNLGYINSIPVITCYCV